MSVNTDSIYQTITETDLFNEDALDMGVAELTNFSNTTITYHENKAFFSYYGDTYALRLEDESYSEKIDAVSDAQMVPYQEEVVLLETDDTELHLHYLDPNNAKRNLLVNRFLYSISCKKL